MIKTSFGWSVGLRMITNKVNFSRMLSLFLASDAILPGVSALELNILRFGTFISDVGYTIL